MDADLTTGVEVVIRTRSRIAVAATGERTQTRVLTHVRHTSVHHDENEGNNHSNHEDHLPQ